MAAEESRMDELLKKPLYIMDILPEQVGRDAGGQFFEVEEYLLNSDKHLEIKNRFEAVILKLMCYFHVAVRWKGWADRPSPDSIDQAIGEIMEKRSGALDVLLVEEDTLLVFDFDCLNLAVYNPPERVRGIMEKIAGAEGLFWRRSEG